MQRLFDWQGVNDPRPLTKTDCSRAVDLACTDQGTWRGNALLISDLGDWTLFCDLSGGYSSIPARRWQEFAKNDDFVFASYNDAIGFAELVVIESGQILREFLDSPDQSEENVNIGRLPVEADRCFQDWVDIASFVDSDDLGFSPIGWLWVQEWASTPDAVGSTNAQSNLDRWIADGGPMNWIRARLGRWDDNDWEELVEELKITKYWPLDPDSVGQALEQATRDYEHEK